MKTFRRITLLVALVVTAAGCGGAKKDEAGAPEQTPAERPDMAGTINDDAAEPADGSTPEPETKIETRNPEPPAPKPAPKPVTPKPETPKPAPPEPKAPAEVTVPAGTVLKATLNQNLSSHESKPGDTFTLRVSSPIEIAGYTAIPAGSTINGVVVDAKPSGKIKGRGDITLAFKSVTDANGTTRDISAEEFYGQAEGATDRDAATIAGGAGAGAIVGGIVGGKKGALIGGLIGGAAGTGTVLATSGPQVKIASGSEFAVTLNSSIFVPPGPKVGN